MGSKFEIQVWTRREWLDGEYGYEEFWRGESVIGAIVNLIRARQYGYGCVTLSWR